MEMEVQLRFDAAVAGRRPQEAASSCVRDIGESLSSPCPPEARHAGASLFKRDAVPIPGSGNLCLPPVVLNTWIPPEPVEWYAR